MSKPLSIEEAQECIRLLTDVVDQVLPQAGKIVMDFMKTNEGLMLARRANEHGVVAETDEISP
jgi:hypothetical protein